MLVVSGIPVMELLQVAFPGGIELLVIFLAGVLPFLVGLVVSVLVYRDAKGRESNHALAWALGAFFGGFVVWVLYLFVRDEVGPGGAARGA